MENYDKTYTKENSVFQGSEEYDEEMGLAFPPYELDELTEKAILSDDYLGYLCALKDSNDKDKLLEQIRNKAKDLKVLTRFNSAYTNKIRELSSPQKTPSQSYKNKLWYDEEEFDEEEEMGLAFPPYEIDELDEEKILSDELMDYLCAIRNCPDKLRMLSEIRQKAKKLKILRDFNAIYKLKEQELGEKPVVEVTQNTIVFPEMKDLTYVSTHYNITDEGAIVEEVPKQGDVLVCYHPILPLERYSDVEDGIHRIKLGFYVDNKWRNIIVEKILISSNQAIINLSKIGVSVTSENARFLVRYLSEIENLNRDKVPIKTSISRLGWLRGEFIPYTAQYEYGGDTSFQCIFDSITSKGDYEKWKNELKKQRSHSKTLRFMMAASFASPLLEFFQLTPFIVHLWGKSGTGKTITLMVCASIWGNPEMGKLLTSLNITEVALEARLGFLHSLPALFDEYQMAKDYYDKSFDNLIYKMTEGKGKDRSNIDVRFKKFYNLAKYYSSIRRRTYYQFNF